MATRKKTVTNVVEMSDSDVKGRVVKFLADDEDAPVRNVYVSKKLVAELGGCEDGIKITIEALEG